MRRFGLRDDHERIKNDLLPGREGSVGVTAADNGLFVEAVLYRYRPRISGAICRSASVTEFRCTVGSAAGPIAVSGSECFNISPQTPTTNMR